MLLNKIPVIYINLQKRIDRKISILKELSKIGVENPEQFKAIELANGAIGCSMSHLKCVELAKKNNYDYLFICEDDLEFLNPELFLKQLNLFMNSPLNWDVVIVAGNNMTPYTPISEYCIKVCYCQTTTGYIVKNHYYDTLINNYKEGITKLLKDQTNNDYKIDKYWFNLQRIHNWYLIIPLSIIQKEGYSDIERKNTNYINYMLNYNKCVLKK
jgi:GR25 family glycosyltransferase involved in LPS biosynthesis